MTFKASEHGYNNLHDFNFKLELCIRFTITSYLNN